MLSLCIRSALREMSPIARTANGLWQIECLGEWAFCFLPSHVFCDPAHIFFSATQTLKDTTTTHTSPPCDAFYLWRRFPVAHQEVRHSDQVFTCPPMDRELKSSLSRSESLCLFLFFFLPLSFLHPPPSWNKHTALCCTQARSHPSALLVIE